MDDLSLLLKLYSKENILRLLDSVTPKSKKFIGVTNFTGVKTSIMKYKVKFLNPGIEIDLLGGDWILEVVHQKDKEEKTTTYLYPEFTHDKILLKKWNDKYKWVPTEDANIIKTGDKEKKRVLGKWILKSYEFGRSNLLF